MGKGSSGSSMAPATSTTQYAPAGSTYTGADGGTYKYQTQAQAQAIDAQNAATPSFQAFEMPDFSEMISEMMAQRQSYEQQQSALQDKYDEESKKALGLSTLDTLFSDRVAAANKAISDVNQQISDEAAHASTRGIDYEMTPEKKQERIDNLFADYWSEADDAKFTQYQKEYGGESHQWTLPVKRGTGTGSKEGALPKEGDKVGGKVTPSGGTVLTEDEESKKTLLGA